MTGKKWPHLTRPPTWRVAWAHSQCALPWPPHTVPPFQACKRSAAAGLPAQAEGPAGNDGLLGKQSNQSRSGTKNLFLSFPLLCRKELEKCDVPLEIRRHARGCRSDYSQIEAVPVTTSSRQCLSILLSFSSFCPQC